MKKSSLFIIVPLLTLTIFSGTLFGSLGRDIIFRYKPTIVWSPPEIKKDVFFETTELITATFISRKDLENVRFWLTPPLKRYAVVEPETIDEVKKNQEYTVQIIVSLPFDISSKTYKESDLDNDIKGLDKELKDYLGENKDLKEYLRKFLKKRIPGLLFVTSEETVPWFKFWKKDREHKIRIIHPKALKIMIKVKEPTVEEIPIDEVTSPTLEKIYEDTQTGAVYIKDEILIGFKEGTSEIRIKEIVAEVNGGFLGSIPDLGLYQVRVPVTDPSELDVIIQHLKSYTEVKVATYHWIDYWDKEPNDEKFDSWNEEQPGGNNWGRELVKFPSAWEFTTGIKEVIVGIVDNGFDIEHEDLEPNISPLSSVKLIKSHGTHAAGIVGAKGTPKEEPTGKGIAGVMWDSTLFLHSVNFPVSDIFHNILPSVLGMKHAVDAGSKIINYSAGTKELKDLAKVEEFNELWKILIYWANRKRDDILFVFSAGNDESSHIYHSPSILSKEYDNIISVAAIDQTEGLSSYSNYGDISVAAPGGDGLPFDQGDIFSTLPNNEYGYLGGTSMAAPFVSGLAGLIWSEAEEDPKIELTAAQVKNLIVQGAELGGKYVSGPDGHKIYIINAFKSLALVRPPTAVELNDPTDITTSSMVLSWSKNDDPDFESYRLYRDTNPDVGLDDTLVTTITDRETLSFEDTNLSPNTTYYYKVFVFDAVDLSSPSNEVSATTLSEIPAPGLADTPWPMFHHDLRHTGQSEYLGAQTAALKWAIGAGSNPSRSPSPSKSSPAIGPDGTIYIGSISGYLYAINPDGTYKWWYQVGNLTFSSPAVASDGTIYIGSHDYNLYAIRPDGTFKWKYTTGAEVSSSPAIGPDGTVYVGSEDGNLYAIKPTDTSRELKWKYPTGNLILSSPAIDSHGIIYIGSMDNHLYAINPDGSLKWKYDTGGWVYSPPSIDSEGVIYIGTYKDYEGDLYAINPDGTLKWVYPVGARIYSSPAIASDGTIYVGSEDRNLYAFNPDGTLKWKYLTNGVISYSSPAVGLDGTIYIGSGYGQGWIYALKEDGTLKWSYTTPAEIDSSPAIDQDGTVYVLAWKVLYAFGE